MTNAQVWGSVYIIDAEYHGWHKVLGTYVVKGSRSMVIDLGPRARNRLVEEGFEEELNMDNIYDRIRREDPHAALRSGMHSDRREMTALFNLRGFAEYNKLRKDSNSKS